MQQNRCARAAFAAIVGVAGSLASPCRAQPITVVNGGFESPGVSLCSFGTVPTGWTVVGDGGLWRPGVLGECLSSYRLGPPQGQQIVFTNSPTISQTLAATLAANTQYTLRVKVGRRWDCCQPSGTNYVVQLWAGGTMLAQDAGSLVITNGTWRQSVVRFATGASHASLGQPLQIRLLAGVGGQSNYDDVQLVAAPADCNANGVFDSVDIANGAPDANANGVPDSCEFPHACAADCAPPVVGDGQVNVTDLLSVINAWGTCAGCAADIAPAHGNGQVNVSDLLGIINNWGPCP